jgi:hypothetical protein
MDASISNLLSAFFVNEYINKFRTKSLEYVEKKKYPDKAQAYRNIIHEYQKMVCGSGNMYGPIYYNRVMESFFVSTYKSYINAQDSFLTFIDRITLELLPQAHYNLLGNNYDKKQNILMGIVRKTIEEYTPYVLSNVQIILGDKNSKEFVANSKKSFNDLLVKNSTTFVSVISHNVKGNISVDNLLASLTEYKRNYLMAQKKEQILKQQLDTKTKELKDIKIKYNELALKHNKLLSEFKTKETIKLPQSNPKSVSIVIPETPKSIGIVEVGSNSDDEQLEECGEDMDDIDE